MTGAVPALVDHLFRHEYGRIVASLTRIFGAAHLDLAEDVVQEALARALKTWPYAGVPGNPAAWLVQVAKRLALDAARRNALERRKEEEVGRWARDAADDAERAAASDDGAVGDDRLRMFFACCHPALPLDARVALTLKTLCGFSVPEIARALLAQEAAVAQRLVRAKRRLQEENVTLDVPGPAELARRRDGVLEVLYLMFAEGHAAHGGDDLVREEVAGEALRLGELLLQIEALRRPKVHALLALLWLQGARLPARRDERGEPVSLARQDRSRWDAEWIRRGFRHFERAIEGDEVSAYHVEAAIASCHAAAPSYADTDWETILARYDQLRALDDSPVVALNRAVALAKARGVDAGLEELASLSDRPSLRGYFWLPATRGLLLWTRGERGEAAACFRRALELGGSEPERRSMLRRIRLCEAGAAPEPF